MKREITLEFTESRYRHCGLSQEALLRCRIFIIIISSYYNAHKMLALFLIPQKHRLDFRAKNLELHGHFMPIRKTHQHSSVRVTQEAKMALCGRHSSQALLATSYTTPTSTRNRPWSLTRQVALLRN